MRSVISLHLFHFLSKKIEIATKLLNLQELIPLFCAIQRFNP